MAVQVTRRPFTVEEYHRLAQVGVVGEDERVELIEGDIIRMPLIGSRHAACVDRLNHLFSRISRDVIVRVQGPLRLGERSEPQPDVAVLKWHQDFYAEEHPGANDVVLVVEVSETSATYDREMKVSLYGRHGVPEVWVVDLEREVIEVYRGPSAAGYAEVKWARRGDGVPSLALGRKIAVDDVLG